jgi:hypothetical protein
MSDFDLDRDLQMVSDRVADLAHAVTIDPRHKARLREELLRRHQELSAGTTQRAARTLWPRFPRLKRLTLVAPPALAAAAILSMMLWSLPIFGHQTPQAAEAQRITQALVRTVPTVTRWRVTVNHQGKNETHSIMYHFELNPNQRLYVVGHRTLVYSPRQWASLAPGPFNGKSVGAWQWAFAVLPARLANHQFSILSTQNVAGRATDRIQYSVDHRGIRSVEATAWVDQKTGLVIRLERAELIRGHVVQRDYADYQYESAR